MATPNNLQKLDFCDKIFELCKKNIVQLNQDIVSARLSNAPPEQIHLLEEKLNKEKLWHNAILTHIRILFDSTNW